MSWVLIAATASLFAEPPALTMAVAPEIGAGGYEALRFTLTFEGEADGTTTLRLPDRWGGETDLWRGVSDLAVEGGVISDGAGPAERVVTHAPGARLTVSYRIRQLHEGEPSIAHPNEFRPVIQPGYFHVMGNTAVVRPSHIDGDAPVEVSLPRSTPGQAFASDLEHGDLVLDDLGQSIMVGGDFRIIDGGEGARLAIRGDWPRPDADWRDSFLKLSTAVRAYWRTEPEPYLVTILPIAGAEGGVSNVGGTGLRDAFALFATPNAQGEKLDEVMTHEMTHTWAPLRLGRMPQPNNAAFWLSEGFTDWATWRALAQGGVWSEARLVEAINEALYDYDLSPVRALPNAEAAEIYWTSQEGQRLPYLRGALLAMRWDAVVRQATGGARDFDDVLLTMQTRAGAVPDVGVVQNLIAAMIDVAGVDPTADIAAMVERGEPVALPAGAYAACGGVETITRPPFHRGFDVEATQAAGNVITGVVVDGPAWRAGLRDGMTLVRRTGGVTGDATQPITYELIDGDRALSLSWLPAGPGEERFRRLSVSGISDACGPQLTGR